MKSKVEKKTYIDRITDYPCIGFTSNYGRGEKYVLFSDASDGVVIHSTDFLYPVGFKCDSWNITNFKPFHGKITIETE